ncbi:MAG TPA: hypothetical protein DCQ26_15885 [Marinilabiliales bacterium]|nr:MAG: hypothetical protein A2W96_08450 [Bacteroidetes bacterium GWD2_40_43]OFX93990.1 MAG: hypothetical protein A2W97_14375 [Bacteroidetes bacterium GWE2_40_63]OFY19779.1 MAG: hypothetical protein A2W88_03245 [Bacteroidetes bacterium GWF2_40_13]HAN00080.1 hypothetical protein [Marinilabiliales bacterium]HAZ00877.1 hypothetical protein [Marinilabiliales bacterium]
MKNRTRYLIAVVLFCLMALIFIQFIWIFKAADDQERHFEYTVIAALSKSTEGLLKQNAVCTQVTNCFNQKGFTCCEKRHLSNDKWNFIDSIIKAELVISKISLDYEFQLTTVPHPHAGYKKNKSRKNCFSVKSNLVTENQESIWLHITFPDRNKFILAQMGLLFFTSILLIAIIIGAFLLIYRYYLQELNLAQDTRNFINNLTHEFKTPLASIRLANNRISKEIRADSKLEAYTRIIKQENDKLDTHINYLLDVSRLKKGKMPMNFDRLNMHEQIERQADSFRLMIEERQGNLTLDLAAGHFWVRADCFHILNALNNLLDNACKYSIEPPEIQIKTSNKSRWLVISITDEGIGIDKSDQKFIFQEFSRVDTGNIHNIKGFGLGLSYVWQVVTIHNGKLLLHSKKGVGSTFSILLPYLD